MIDETRLHDKLDDMATDLADIKTTLAVNTQSLQEHMRRTVLLETAVEPIKRHVAMVNGAAKLITLLGVLAGLAAAVKQLF